VKRKSAPELVEQLLHPVEGPSLASHVFGLGFPDLGHEDGPPEGAELGLIAFVAVRVDDVGSPPGALEHDQRLVARLNIVQNLGRVLAQLTDRDRLHTLQRTYQRTFVNRLDAGRTIRILPRIVRASDGSYDVHVPNKTIYVSDGDLPLYDRAQAVAGGNLSAAIAKALRRYVDVEDGRSQGFDEITVRIVPGGRKVRFSGLLIGELANSSSSSSRWEVFRVYRSRTGKFVLHIDRTAEYSALNAEGKPAGWRGYLGLGDISYANKPAESTLDVFDSLDQLRDRIPAQLYEMVAGSARQPFVEDLDI